MIIWAKGILRHYAAVDASSGWTRRVTQSIKFGRLADYDVFNEIISGLPRILICLGLRSFHSVGRADKIGLTLVVATTDHSLTGRLLTLFLSAPLWYGRDGEGDPLKLGFGIDSREPAPSPSGYYRIYSTFILLIPYRPPPPASDRTDRSEDTSRAIHKGQSLFSCIQIKILLRQIKAASIAPQLFVQYQQQFKLQAWGMQKSASNGRNVDN